MSADSSSSHSLKRSIVRFAREAMELPGLSLLSKPLYRRYFSKPYLHGNIYHGIYASYEEALLDAKSLSSKELPATSIVRRSCIGSSSVGYGPATIQRCIGLIV
jgi:hypothetical protein